jgi:glycyl-tRNA synthetase beta chain
MAKANFLLEVRCEEIPARMLQPAIRELATRLFEELMARNLAPEEVSTGFTPRRLVVILRDVPVKEADRRVEQLGPPTSVSFDEDGKPLAAAIGFAKRCGIDVQELNRVRTEKGEYVAAELEISGRPASEILAEIAPQILGALSWRKVMRWGDGQGPWVRPVQGVLALFGGEVVSFEFMGVQSTGSSVGHPIHSPRQFQVRGAADFGQKLARRNIEPRFDLRRAAILEQMVNLAGDSGGTLVSDDELLDKLACICEIPGVIVGEFSSTYLSLPREVLATSLRDHQSAFTVEDDGDLLPVFLTVMDCHEDTDGLIRAGNEWVVEARLADAQFFYAEDRKIPMVDRAELLKGLTFHEELGTYADKTKRLMHLVEVLCDELGWEEEKAAAVEATGLLKVDLTTEVVKEFTSLQGVIGGVYARDQGHAEAVWQAIYDHYLPNSATDPVPRSRVGQVVTLADRIDLLVGVFGLGLIPSGSKDPFGLRRAAQGAVKVALEGDLKIDFDLISARAVLLYEDRLRLNGDEVLAALRPFFQDRIRHLLGLEGYVYDEIDACLGAGGSDLPDLRRRVDALHRVRGEPGFLSVVLAAKRIANIVKDTPEYRLDEGLLNEPAETNLFASSRKLRDALREAEGAAEYDKGLRKVAEFSSDLERFFVEVLVMDENRELRKNRIALLQSIQRTLSRTARLTEVVVDRAEHRERSEAS